MSKIMAPLNESVWRLESAVSAMQVEYRFLSMYLSEAEKSKYAKAFVDMEDIVQTLECISADMEDGQ